MLSQKDIRLRYAGNDYIAYHAPRYVILLRLLVKYGGQYSSILDVGNSICTRLIYDYVNAQVDSLGFDEDAKTEFGNNYQFDLNNSSVKRKWRKDIPKYDIIIFSEVIEHLYTSPLLVLGFLKSLLKDDGVLIIQTPNSIAFHKRIKLLFGKTVYELINEDINDPRHFREYTETELHQYAFDSGFVVTDSILGSYFDYRFRGHTLGRDHKVFYEGYLNKIYTMLPRSLKPGITLILRNKIQ